MRLMFFHLAFEFSLVLKQRFLKLHAILLYEEQKIKNTCIVILESTYFSNYKYLLEN